MFTVPVCVEIQESKCKMQNCGDACGDGCVVMAQVGSWLKLSDLGTQQVSW